MQIKNIAELSNEKLTAKLIKLGHNVPEERKNDRFWLIAYCRENNLWKYMGDVVPPKYKAKYGQAQNCGDEMAEAFTDYTKPGGKLDLEALNYVATQNGVDMGRWSHCNDGQKRMNLGNILRGKLRRGEYVIIGHYSWNNEAKNQA